MLKKLKNKLLTPRQHREAGAEPEPEKEPEQEPEPEPEPEEEEAEQEQEPEEEEAEQEEEPEPEEQEEQEEEEEAEVPKVATLEGTLSGSELTVQWTLAQGKASGSDYLALFASGAGDDDYEAGSYEYLEDGATEGSVTMQCGDLSDGGSFEVRFYDAAQSKCLDARHAFVFEKPKQARASGSVSATVKKDVVKVTWQLAGGEVSSSDFVGLFLAGADDSDYTTYAYASGELEGEAEIDISDVREADTYNVRYIDYNSNSALATSPHLELKGHKTPEDVQEEQETSKQLAKAKHGKLTVEYDAEAREITVEWDMEKNATALADFVAVFEGLKGGHSWECYKHLHEKRQKGKLRFTCFELKEGRTYSVRYLKQEDNRPMAVSAPFTVPKGVAFKCKPEPDGSLNVNFDAESQQLVVEFKAERGQYKMDRAELRVLPAGTINPNEYVKFESLSQYVPGTKKHVDLLGELKEGEEYYARLAAEDHTIGQLFIATSNPFTVNGLVKREDQSICALTAALGVEEEEGGKQLVVTVEWDFQGNKFRTTQQDSIVLVPDAVSTPAAQWGWDEKVAEGYGSGKPSGKVQLHLVGLVKGGETLRAHYVSNGMPAISLGASAAFTVGAGDVPSLSDKEREEAQLQSRRFNGASSQQHSAKEYLDKLNVSINPLLTIQPEKGKWQLLMEQTGKNFKVGVDNMGDGAEGEGGEGKGKEAGGEKAGTGKAVSAAQADSGGVKDDVMDEAKLTAEVVAAFDNTPGFIYAGAGVSMSAPSSSPSWWRLMNELLETTFKAAPDEHADIRDMLSGGDATRQPEEIMESYYFVLQDRLFTLFQLLEAGNPNSNHKAMAKLAKAGRVKAILTTNFDIFIERALRDEGVDFKVIVTNEEFRDYHERGCGEFAVLKIHGTIDRPDTIVAVANHYKMGKGFGGYKAVVLKHFLRRCPTLFLGYSGWDFEHANYQAFWADVGQEPCQNVFWLTLKGFGGGPVLTKLVGTHIGSSLRIGASSLPEFACDVLKVWDGSGAQAVLDFHHGVDVDAVNKDIVTKRMAFLKGWVAQLPKPALLTFLMMEAMMLNEKSQSRFKKQAKVKKEADGGASDQAAMTAALVALGGELAAGKITMEQYMEKQELISLEMTFAHVLLEKDRKEALKLEFLRDTKSHPFLTSPDGQAMKPYIPGLLMMISEVATDSTTPREMMDRAIDYLQNSVLAHSLSDPRGKIIRESYMYTTAILKCTGKDREKADKLVQDFADKAIAEQWEDSDVNDHRIKELMPAINRMAYGQLDIEGIVKTQIKYTLESASESTELFLEMAMSVALGVLRQSSQRMGTLSAHQTYVQQIMMPLQQNADLDIPAKDFLEVEADVNAPLKPLVDKLQSLKGHKGGGKVGADEVLATLEVAAVELWYQVLQYAVGRSYYNRMDQEKGGFYPKEQICKSGVAFMKPRIVAAAALINDERVVQPALALMAKLGEAEGDLDVIRAATERSLQLTQGKVTELTPYPIPECLAVAYQGAGDMDNALKFYTLALDGIKTCVMRTKTDAVVLNACLIQALKDKKQALRWVFTYSPHFSSAQIMLQRSPCRPLLLQQAAKWAQELGFADLAEAETKLMTREE